MLRKSLSLRSASRRSSRFPSGRSLRYETMEGRLVLSASGFAGNECAPEFDEAAMAAIAPSGEVSVLSEIAFQFAAADVISDSGAGATDTANIQFTLDPDVGSRTNGATPDGATLSFNDQGNSDPADDTWDFSWAPAEAGEFRLFIIGTDDGGTDNVPLSDVFSFEVNVVDNPQVDLNGTGADGIDFGPVEFVENAAEPVSIVDTDNLSIPFAKNDELASARIQIANPQDGDVETLGIDAGDLIVDSSTPGVLVLTVDGGGLADKSVFETALRTLTYSNSSDDPIATQNINITVNDGMNDSDTAVATVNITAVNDAPDLLQTEAELEAAKVGEQYILDLEAIDLDGGDAFIFQLQNGPTGAVITPNAAGSSGQNTTIITRDPTDGRFKAQIVWTPTAEQSGSSPVLFTVSVSDGESPLVTDVEVFSVPIMNQAPTANDDPTPGNDALAVGEDDGNITNLGNVLTNDTDPENDTLTVKSVTAGGSTFDVGVAFTHPTSGAAISVSEDGQVDYNPNGEFEALGAGEQTTDTFQYTIEDDEGNESGLATVTVTINGANDAPTDNGTEPRFEIRQDAGPTELPLADFLAAVDDVDANDSHTIPTAPDNPSEGGLFAKDGDLLRFDPNGDFSLTEGQEQEILFMVTIEDSAGAPITIEAKLVIQGVNIAPVAVDDPASGISHTTTEDLPLEKEVAEGLLNNDTDAEGATLQVAEVNGDAANVGADIQVQEQSGTRTATLNVQANGSFTLDPAGNFDSLALGETSTITFTYKATDGASINLLSNEATVTVTIVGVNNDPVANDDSFSTDEDTPLTSGNVLDNDDDVDGGDLTVTRLTVNGSEANLNEEIDVTSAGSRAGRLTLGTDGSVQFTPSDEFDELAQDAVDTVMFSYTAFDNIASSLTDGTATITINGVKDEPIIDEAALASSLQTALGLGAAPDLTQPIEVPENVAINFDFLATVNDVDTDTDDLTFAHFDTIPSDLNQPTLGLNNGQFNWTPDANTTPSEFTITLIVRDATSPGPTLEDSIALTFRVITPVV